MRKWADIPDIADFPDPWLLGGGIWLWDWQPAVFSSVIGKDLKGNPGLKYSLDIWIEMSGFFDPQSRLVSTITIFAT